VKDPIAGSISCVPNDGRLAQCVSRLSTSGRIRCGTEWRKVEGLSPL
jgi:hypothetical protein